MSRTGKIWNEIVKDFKSYLIIFFKNYKNHPMFSPRLLLWVALTITVLIPDFHSTFAGRVCEGDNPLFLVSGLTLVLPRKAWLCSNWRLPKAKEQYLCKSLYLTCVWSNILKSPNLAVFFGRLLILGTEKFVCIAAC